VCLQEVEVRRVRMALGHKIRKINRQGAVVTIAGSGTAGFLDGVGVNTQFHSPFGVCFSEGQECLYVADHMNHRIRRVDVRSGAVVSISGTGVSGLLDGSASTARLHYPIDVKFFEGTRCLLVVDFKNHTIRRIAAQEKGEYLVDTLAGSGVAGTEVGKALQSKFSSPYSLCIDQLSNTCYIADTNNHRIVKLSVAKQ